MVWEAAPGRGGGKPIVRLTAAMLPVAMLMVTRRIIDSIYVVTSHQTEIARGILGSGGA